MKSGNFGVPNCFIHPSAPNQPNIACGFWGMRLGGCWRVRWRYRRKLCSSWRSFSGMSTGLVVRCWFSWPSVHHCLSFYLDILICTWKNLSWNCQRSEEGWWFVKSKVLYSFVYNSPPHFNLINLINHIQPHFSNLKVRRPGQEEAPPPEGLGRQSAARGDFRGRRSRRGVGGVHGLKTAGCSGAHLFRQWEKRKVVRRCLKMMVIWTGTSSFFSLHRFFSHHPLCRWWKWLVMRLVLRSCGSWPREWRPTLQRSKWCDGRFESNVLFRWLISPVLNCTVVL